MSDESREEPGNEQDPANITSLHVRRACAGDRESLGWVVERFSPLLFANARYRLGDRLRSLYDPEDLVNEVWTVALPRLAELPARDGRYTPVILKFLSTALRNKVNNLIQKHISGKPQRQHAAKKEEGAMDTVSGLEEDVTGIVTRVARREVGDVVSSSLEKLDPADREIIILRGIEQHPYKEIAAVLGGDPKALSVHYGRALQKLRKQLPNSVYSEFVDE